MKMLKSIVFLLTFLFFVGIPRVNAASLPKVYIRGDLSGWISKKEFRKVEFQYRSQDLSFDGYAKIKLQGNSSLSYAKKNYTIQLYQDDAYQDALKVDVGFGKQNKYCLKANWVDKTHARNIVTARIYAQIQSQYHLFEETPHFGVIDGFPVEIYLNDDFLGLYTWNIPKDSWMFNMDEDDKNHLIIAGQDNALYQEQESWDANSWTVESGEESEESLQKFNRLMNFIQNSTIDTFKTKIQDYIQLNALINYYVMSEFAYLVDNLGKNMLLVTYDGKIWYPSLYDLDTSFGTNFLGTEVVSSYQLPLLDENYIESYPIFSKLLEAFPDEVANRYFALRKDILTKENILEQFRAFEETIPEETFEKENERWKDIPGYDFQQIEEFLNERIPYLDQYFYQLYQTKAGATIQYQRNKNGSMTATFVPSREDIVVTNNKGKTTYTFKKAGSFVFEYQDGMGQKMKITAEVTSKDMIDMVQLIISSTLVIVSLVLLIFFIRYEKKHKKYGLTKSLQKPAIPRRRRLIKKRKK